MTTATEHRKFICVEFGETNNNKVWQYTLYNDGSALTEWGRVGKTLQSKITTESKALQKQREKTNSNNKPDKFYTEVKATGTGGDNGGTAIKNAHLHDVARKQIKHSNPIVQNLIDYLVKVNAHQITSATGGKILFDTITSQFKTPLGVIEPSQVMEARNLLSSIATFVRDRDFCHRDFNNKLNQYLRLIPHDVGMKKISPSLIFPDFAKVQQENDLLDGLETSFADIISNGTKKTKKTAPKVFNVEMEIVEDSKVISYVKKLYQTTRLSMHQSNSLSVQRVYKVDISNMLKAYSCYGSTLKDIRHLWHGTKASNLLSIMKKGLIIPPDSSPHCTGRMYGNGVYFSSISTKALNYATNYHRGGGSIDRTFMFLADVAMGKYHLAKSSWHGYPKKGYDSTWAKGGTAGVINDEMIVYRLDQCNLVYLVEFVPRNQYKS